MRIKIINCCNRICEFCLYFLIFFIPFAKAAVQVFLWLAISAWLFKKAISYSAQNSSHLHSARLNKPLFAFLIICLISTVMSINFGLSFRALLTKIIKNVILYFIVIEVINNIHYLKKVLAVIAISASLIIIDAGMQYFRGVDFLRGYVMDSSGIQASFGSRNSFGGWLIIIIPIFFGIIKSNRFFLGRLKKIGLTGLFVLSLICLGLSSSRASWIGFLLSFIFIGFYSISLLNKRFKVLATFIIILVTISFSFILPQTIKARINSIIRLENSNLFRINLWKESLEIIEDFPVFGVGLNTYTKIGPTYAKAGGGYYPHNSYLHMAAEIGIVGLLCFLLIIAKFFKQGLYVLKKSKDSLLLGLLGAILAFLVQSFFDVNFYALQLATLFWFILGLTVARINILINEGTYHA